MSAAVLVTGADGLIGRAVCRMLSSEGIDFLGITKSPGDDTHGLAHDLTRQVPLVDVVNQPVSGIVHLAAAVPITRSCPDDLSSAESTRRIDRTILAAAYHWQCPVMYASTCGLYDSQLPNMKNEDCEGAIAPRTPYLAAKLDGEQRFLDYGNSVVMRIAAAVGPGQRKSTIVSRFIETARAGQPITLWGTGRRQQNFVSTADIAVFIGLALRSEERGVFNVASDTPTSMRTLAHEVVAVIGRGSVAYADVGDPEEGATAHYDTTRATKTFGWRCQVSLARMLEQLRTECFRD